MGSYTLIDNILHRTIDGWQSVELSSKEVELWKKGELDTSNLKWE